ncbi:hypothetical protein ACLKA6_005277 [Drosophila palustris]
MKNKPKEKKKGQMPLNMQHNGEARLREGTDRECFRCCGMSQQHCPTDDADDDDDDGDDDDDDDKSNSRTTTKTTLASTVGNAGCGNIV